jgi:AraC-like DNA-binding protein
MTANGLQFDSALVAPRERFDAYHALYAGGADVTQSGDGFHARMRGWRLDRSLVYDRHLYGVGHARDAGRVRRDAMEHLTLTLVIDGEFHADSGDGFRRIAPGELLLLDMTRPMRNQAPGAHIVTMSMARERVAEWVRDPRAAHGRVLAPQTAALLADHMRSLVRHGSTLGPAALVLVGRVGADLLGAALAEGARERPAHQATLRIDRVRAFIEEHLFAADFGVETVLARFALSRATLYRDFQPWGGLAAYIRRRRIEALGDRLADVGEARSLADLAEQIGFSTEARQSEAFLAHYGMRPGAYRRAAQREAPVVRSLRHMREWQGVLR